MKRMKKDVALLICGLLLILAGTGTGQASPVNADIVVAKDGSGDYTTLQAAINAVPSNHDRRTIIYIKRGLYDTEKLIIPADKKDISLIGESRDETVISYHIYDCATGKCPAEDAALWTGDNITTSATLTICGDGFRAENLTIQNTAGPVGQAQAITVRADRTVFINCNIKGYQDTIYLWDSGKRSYFENCQVIGRTDYIYGAAIAYFQGCEIRSWGGGWITAPSTPLGQGYGYVFNECGLTYATGSPRAGDDGSLIALGRPWHEYPKVTWMNSYFCAEINPLGWPTTWNMDYASTSTDLELYEYNNYGPGADMSGRADWAGIRELDSTQAADYTIQKVLAGSDNWDPTDEPPLVTTYVWTDSALTNGWLLPENWSPKDTPLLGEIAVVDSGFNLNADGGYFLADLYMKSGSILNITDTSFIIYLALSNARITASDTVTLAGKISTKDTNTFKVAGMLTIEATITGVHHFNFTDTGTVILRSDNGFFDGNWYIQKGKLEAATKGSLGTGNVFVASGSTLIIGDDNAFHPTSRLEVETGASLVLNGNIFLSEFYIDGIMQEPGEYSSSANPELITGNGAITVGRPAVFQFIGGANGNWDNPLHYIPQLLPQAGELVICDREMETTSTVFTADILLTGSGGIRLRGIHTCTGLITMEQGARLSYATSGTGFTLNAHIKVNGDIILQMSSANVSGSAMRLPGSIEGSHKITAKNIRDLECVATVILSGDNNGFDGIWDLTVPSTHAAAVTAIEGAGENAFGHGRIQVGDRNKVILSHKKCAADTLYLTLTGAGKAVLNADVYVEKFVLNSVVRDTGTYSAITNPEIFEGEGELKVGIPEPPNAISAPPVNAENLIQLNNKTLIIKAIISKVSVYDMNGIEMIINNTDKTILLDQCEKGVYIVNYCLDGISGTMKIIL
ncbi:MAG: hypothetical protein JW723_12230 [Bacteroidales bacterium]|nr:hypothetical protein [Bacteroidales bacterium]